MNIESLEARLVLLCPAWKNWGTAATVKFGTTIFHRRADDIILFANSEKLLRKRGLPIESLIETGKYRPRRGTAATPFESCVRVRFCTSRRGALTRRPLDFFPL